MDRGPVNAALTLPSIGDLVDGRFRIERKLGEGGTSTVYEVSHVITDKRFAIKWLLPELALDDAAVDRFIHEARVGGKFAHPHAVQVYDICKANDSFYMLMELLEGESLLARLERVGQLPVPQACSIILTCAEVLSAAHRKGIIHRDLKPANIFLCRGDEAARGVEVPKLLDFGISMFCSDLHNLSLVTTPRGSVIGTPLYMSPEQMLGQRTDARSDIYALGAVLYELVSGQPPYQADSYGELVVKVTVNADAPRLDQVAPVDAAFARVVAKAMAREPGARYASVAQLLTDLRPFAVLPEPAAASPSSADRSLPDTSPQQLEHAPEPTGPHGMELTPAYGTSLGLPGQMLRRSPTAAGIAAVCAAMLGWSFWYRSASSSADMSTAHLRPRPIGSASVEEPSASLDPFASNGGASEVLTGRAPPDDVSSIRVHSVRAGGLATNKPVFSAKRGRTPGAGAALASVDSSPVAPARPVKLPASHELDAKQPASTPRTAGTARLKSSVPLEDVRIRRSDFEPQVPATPPAAHVRRDDF